MNVQRKNAALSKFGEQIKANPDGARIALKESDKNYTDAEIDEIIASASGGSSETNISPKVAKSPMPNDAIQEALKEIDYNNVDEVGLEKYEAVLATLVDTQQYDFIQYKASPKFETRLNKKQDKYEKLVGIRLVSQTPINNSRMQLWAAKDLNAQIHNPNNPPTNSRYYFLTKY